MVFFSIFIKTGKCHSGQIEQRAQGTRECRDKEWGMGNMPVFFCKMLCDSEMVFKQAIMIRLSKQGVMLRKIVESVICMDIEP